MKKIFTAAFVSLLLLAGLIIALPGTAKADGLTVTFDSQGGSGIAPENPQPDGTVAFPAVPVRCPETYYYFDGWYTSADCTTPWNFDNTVTQDITLYAKWTTGPRQTYASYSYGDYTYSLINNNMEAVLDGYFGPGGDLTIPDTVPDPLHTGRQLPIVRLCWAWYAYPPSNNMDKVTSAAVPDSVREVNYFFGAAPQSSGYSLTGIYLGSNVKAIDKGLGTGAFSGINTLENINIPQGLLYIGGFSFSGCSNLELDIEIPDGVTYIGDNAFNGSGIKSVVIPDRVTYLGGQAFYSCKNLTSATLGTGITEIKADTFNGDSALSSVVIPDSVTQIGNGAFAWCGLTKLDTAKGVEYWPAYSYNGPVTKALFGEETLGIDFRVFSDGYYGGTADVFFLGNAPAITDQYGEITNSFLLGADYYKIYNAAQTTGYNEGQWEYYRQHGHAMWHFDPEELNWDAPCTVSFDLNGASGTPPAAQGIYEGVLINKPSDPVRDDYDFGGWYADAGCQGGAWDFSTPVASGMTLYAKWSAPDSYTVTFNAQGGSVSPSNKQFIFGEAFGALPVPKRAGYCFFGWYTGAKGSGTLIEADDIVDLTGNITLYAKWVSNSSSLVALSTPSLTVKAPDYKTVTLTWKAVANAKGYVIYKKVNGVYKWLTTVDGALSYTDTGVKEGYYYYYKIRAYRVPYITNAYSAYSSYKYAKPAWPKVYLKAASNGYNSVKLTWNSIAGAKHYRVYRGTSYKNINTCINTDRIEGSGTITYTDSAGLTPGKTYYYRIRAFDDSVTPEEHSPYCSYKYAKPVPSAPAGLEISRAAAASIKLTWNAVEGASGYQVYRAASRTGTYTWVTTTDVTSALNSGLTSGKTYYYKVRAFTLARGARVYGGYSSKVYLKLTPDALFSSMTLAEKYLEKRMDVTTGNLYVYKDFAVNENHFTAKGKVYSGGGKELVHDMDEDCLENPYAGKSCIKCSIGVTPDSWGGWMFLNGRLPEGATAPEAVFGDVDGCTMNLKGASSVTFMARGKNGGERVEFFTGGLGRSAETGQPIMPYPDSMKKKSTGVLTLGKEWRKYTISLTGNNLTSIGCGFGYVVAYYNNSSGSGDVVFYLDEIRFNGNLIPAGTPRFIASYETADKVTTNAAFSYDNALSAMAFTSIGDRPRAKLILDAFVYAAGHDRYSPDRVRNAYAYGDPRIFPGWGDTARLPGYMENGAYYEDAYQVGTNAGNTSFAVLALLKYYSAYGGEEYLGTAKTVMDFIIGYCSDTGRDGFFAGYDGWPENGTVTRFTYKSTEHNIDMYAACHALYQITGEEKYNDAALSALRFVESMYDSERGIFWAGTTADGVTADKSNIVLDVQVWTALALGGNAAPYSASVQYAIDNFKTPGGGYAFSQSYADGGYWLEGTAFSALTFRQCGLSDEAASALSAITAAQLASGGLPAVAGAETLDTGFYLSSGEKWLYYDDPHIAPAAWFILAVRNDNPYVID